MQNKQKIRSMVWTALMAALIAVTAQIVIPLGPVPFSMAVFGVFFAGAMLPPAAAAACVGVYVLLGTVGLPVFAGFNGGPQVLIGPTGGYIAGYFIMAVGTSLAVKHLSKVYFQLGAMVLSLGLCYLLGTVWYSVLTGATFTSGLAVCVAPFVIPDLVKTASALVIAKSVVKRWNTLRLNGNG